MDLETHPLVEAARDWLAENSGRAGDPAARSSEIAHELERLAIVPMTSLQRLSELLGSDAGDGAELTSSGQAADERATNDEYRAVLEAVAGIVHSASGATEAVALLRDAHILLLGGVGPDTPELARKETRQIRQLLGGMLRQVRACGDHDEAREIRARLYSLGIRELARDAH